MRVKGVLGFMVFKLLFYNTLRKYYVFSRSWEVDFCEKWGVVGAFCVAATGRDGKKFKIFTAVPQRVGMGLRKKVKKNFGGLEKGRIFAPAFERGRRPQRVPERGKARVV